MLLLLMFTSLFILALVNSIGMLRQENQLQCGSSINGNWDNNVVAGKYRASPDRVTCFDFYAFNGSSIYFRWNPPVSSTRIIDFYKIRYLPRLGPEQIDLFKASPCTIWPWMHCASIHNLNVNLFYLFELSVKYNNVGWIIEATTPFLDRQTLNPDPPKILSSFWDKHYNLTVEWQYPNKTNGILESFQIDFYYIEYIVPLRTLHLSYSQSIDYRDSLDTDVINVSIICKNMDAKVSKPSLIKIDCPPPTPTLSQQPALINIFDKSIEIGISPLNKNRNSFSYLHVIVTKVASKGDPKVSPSQTKFISQLVDLDPNMMAWIATEYKLYENKSVNLTIGDMSIMFSNITKQEITNWDLPRGVDLKIFIVVLNQRKEFLRFSSYHMDITLPKSISPYIYASFLVLVIPIAYCIYVVRKKKIRFVRI